MPDWTESAARIWLKDRLPSECMARRKFSRGTIIDPKGDWYITVATRSARSGIALYGAGRTLRAACRSLVLAAKKAGVRVKEPAHD